MKTHPIIFSTPMVQAILEGRKTMTRRVVKPQPYFDNDSLWWKWDHRIGLFSFPDLDTESIEHWCPYGHPGDIFWVRETFFQNSYFPEYFYKTDFPLHENHISFKPSIHMPKAAARIFLEVTSIRVERLQDVTTEDAIKEGTSINPDIPNVPFSYKYPFVASFKLLWNSIHENDINKKWNSNPFVWLIEFKRIDKPENF